MSVYFSHAMHFATYMRNVWELISILHTHYRAAPNRRITRNILSQHFCARYFLTQTINARSSANRSLSAALFTPRSPRAKWRICALCCANSTHLSVARATRLRRSSWRNKKPFGTGPTRVRGHSANWSPTFMDLDGAHLLRIFILV